MYNNEPSLATVQTREALRIVKHYFGNCHKGGISYEEKRAQAERELRRNFRTRAALFLAELGFKVR